MCGSGRRMQRDQFPMQVHPATREQGKKLKKFSPAFEAELSAQIEQGIWTNWRDEWQLVEDEVCAKLAAKTAASTA